MISRSQLAHAIRALSMDAVQTAKSGHPGAPMGMADIAEVLWNDFLKHDPKDPHWVDRDRFVLSNGHGSMLLYSLLHLSGYDLPIDELKRFRQLHSKTPGHPEYGYTPGVDTTTGPLGQGLANAVGMALSEKVLAAQFNQDGHQIVDHFTYVFLGDGCLMEGISHEVCSLAGTLGLGKLIAIYDDNGISIDGEIDGWFTDDTVLRFEAYGWQVIQKVDGHNSDEIQAALETARENVNQPTLIICKTTIGYGSPNKAGSESCHGAPLGEEEIALTKQALDWPYPPFEIPEAYYKHWSALERGAQAKSQWQARFAAYQQAFPERATEFERRMRAELPQDFSEYAQRFIQTQQEHISVRQQDPGSLHDLPAKMATRKASQMTITAYAQKLPELFGGSADLAGSNLTLWPEAQGVSADDPSGNYCFYGVREFGMSAIMNGIALHKGLVPFGGTFLIFMEYARNAVRMAALMKQRALFVYTHDSIGLGEDGPTHQPIEQLTTLRATPNLDTWRPCDLVETAVAWKCALERQDGPSALVFSRQNLPNQARSSEQVANIERGGYILREPEEGEVQLILIATGSEIALATQAADHLTVNGVNTRVVSMPSTERFAAQSQEYQQQVLPTSVPARIAIEAGHPDFWYKYVGLQGKVLGINTFGESAPAADLLNHFGFTLEHLLALAETLTSQ